MQNAVARRFFKTPRFDLSCLEFDIGHPQLSLEPSIGCGSGNWQAVAQCRDVRPSSDRAIPMKKPAADFSARAFEDFCDDGAMPVILPDVSIANFAICEMDSQAGQTPVRAIAVVI